MVPELHPQWHTLDFGALLTVGVAWLSQEAGPGGSTRLGASVTSTSVGTIVGPAIGGVLGAGVGLGAPFIAFGAAALLIASSLPRHLPQPS